MHPVLQAMLTETVQDATPTGQDAYGHPTYAAPITRPARVEYKPRRITNAYGQEVISRCRVFLDSTPAMAIDHRLVLPDGTAPRVQIVYPVNDIQGSLHHYEVWL